MAAKLPQMTQTRVLRSEIHVDDTINSRMVYDEKKIAKLADSIKVQGVLHPPVLLRMSQAGDMYEKDKEAKGKAYVLVIGFRRQKALDMLGQDESTYSIAPTAWGLGDAQAANLVENIGREDLSTYEVAMACAQIKEEYDLTAGEIAKRIKAYDSDPEGKSVLSENHVSNMIRCARNLHPDILEAWKNQLPAASLRRLIGLSAKDEPEQLVEWKKLTGATDATDATGDAKDKPKAETKPRRPSDAAVASMVESIKVSDKTDDFKKGAIAGVLWAGGVTGHDKIPGVKWEATAARAPKTPGGAKGKKGKKGEGKGGKGDAPAADAAGGN